MGTIGATACAAGGAAATAPLWTADTSRGTKAFEVIDANPGTVTVVDDPLGQYGSCYRYATPGAAPDQQGRVRIESKGHVTAAGSTLRFGTPGAVYYIGWRSLWQPLPTAAGNWVVLWQLKDYGTGASTPPLSLRARGNGLVDFEYCDPGLNTTQLWTAPLQLGRWHSFVVGIKVSKDPSAGWARLWHNGTAQTLHGGSTQTVQYPCATLRADFVTDKWGVYRSDGVTGPATAYLNAAKVGPSYSSVAPQTR